jgi:hypothetical protein
LSIPDYVCNGLSDPQPHSNYSEVIDDQAARFDIVRRWAAIETVGRTLFKSLPRLRSLCIGLMCADKSAVGLDWPWTGSVPDALLELVPRAYGTWATRRHFIRGSCFVELHSGEFVTCDTWKAIRPPVLPTRELDIEWLGTGELPDQGSEICNAEYSMDSGRPGQAEELAVLSLLRRSKDMA